MCRCCKRVCVLSVCSCSDAHTVWLVACGVRVTRNCTFISVFCGARRTVHADIGLQAVRFTARNEGKNDRVRERANTLYDGAKNATGVKIEVTIAGVDGLWWGYSRCSSRHDVPCVFSLVFSVFWFNNAQMNAKMRDDCCWSQLSLSSWDQC